MQMRLSLKPIEYWIRLSTPAKALLLACIVAAPVIGFMSVVTGAIGDAKPLFLLAVPSMLLLLLALLVDPMRLLLLILLLRGGLDPFLDATKIPIGNASMGLGGVLNGVIILLAFLLGRKAKSGFVGSALKWSAPLMIVFLVNAARSPNTGEAIKFTLGVATYLSAFVIGILLTEKRGVDYTLRVVLHASIPAVLLSMVMLATGWRPIGGQIGSGDFIDTTSRFAGAFNHPNIMAFFMANTAVIALYFFARAREGRGTVRQGTLLAVVLTSTALIVASQTRSAWAATFSVFTLYTLIFNRKALLLLAACLLLIFCIPAVQDRLLDLSDDRGYLIYSTLNSYEWRKRLWLDALNSLSVQGWLWGNGVRSFFTDSPTFFSLGGGIPFGAHSIYIQMIYETGLIGLAIWLIMLVGAMYGFSKAWRTNRSIAFTGLCLVTAYATVCYSDNILSYLVYNIYFWLALGAMTRALFKKNDITAS